MDITGKIIQILPLQEGNGKNGPWKKQDYVLETIEQYPKKVVFNLWTNGIEQYGYLLGLHAVVKVFINLESREYNGKWYTDVRAWKVESVSSDTNTQSPPTYTPDFNTVPKEDDDLPF